MIFGYVYCGCRCCVGCGYFVFIASAIIFVTSCAVSALALATGGVIVGGLYPVGSGLKICGVMMMSAVHC